MGIVSVDVASGEAGRSGTRSGNRWVWIILSVVAVIGILSFGLHVGTHLNVKDLFVDPIAKAGLSPHVGVFSNLGVLAFWSAATMAVGTSLLMQAGEGRQFLLSLGCLIAILALDDLFHIHEELGGVFARYLFPSIDRRLLEGVVFAVYAVAWGAWIVWNRHRIIRGPVKFFALAVFMLGASVVVDLAEILAGSWVESSDHRSTAATVIEELLKLGGILFLVSYVLLVVRTNLQRAIGRS